MSRLLNEAKDFQKKGELLLCLSKLEELVELDQASPPFWTLLGDTLAELKRWQQAEEAFRKALEIDSNHISAYLGLGKMFSDQGKIDEAKACFIKAQEIDPDDEVAQDALRDLSRYGRLN